MVKYRGRWFSIADYDGMFGRTQLMDDEFNTFWVNDSEITDEK